MKSESGVTLVALITIIIVLIIIMSVGIYSGINSYKVINIEKYKAQMQLIQNAVDELYEESKIYSQDNEGKNYFDNKLSLKNYKTSNVKAPAYINNINKFVNNNNVNIDKDTVMNGYYILHKDTLENKLKIDTINVSDYFIINFEKRLVFSTRAIKVKDAKGNDVDIYCLYQLDESEKVIEFKTDGNFQYNIYKEDYKQTVEIINNINIEKVEIDLGDGYVDINARKDYCLKVIGLNTRKVVLDIIKNCKIKVTDTLRNIDEREIQFYNVPVLKENMIPIIPIKPTEGKISYINDPKWYDYFIKGDKIDEENTNFAVAVNAITLSNAIPENTAGYYSDYDNYYKVNVSDTANTILTIPAANSNQPVKVWIPKNLREHVNNTYYGKEVYTEQDFEGTGIWVEAWWNGEKYVPANGN